MSENTTYPGINKAAKFDFLNNEEKKIIKNISRKYWYVTRIERKAFTNSVYNVAFLKPINHITQTLI